MSSPEKQKKRVGRPRMGIPWSNTFRLTANINYQENKLAHTFAMMNQANLSDRIVEAIELLVAKEKDPVLLDDEKRNALVFSMINGGSVIKQKQNRQAPKKGLVEQSEKPELTAISPAAKVEQTHAAAVYSDIASDGGLDSRNEHDAQPPAQESKEPIPSAQSKMKAAIEFGAEQEPSSEIEKSQPTIKSRFLQNHDY